MHYLVKWHSKQLIEEVHQGFSRNKYKVCCENPLTVLCIDVSHPIGMFSRTKLTADPGFDTVTSSFDDALWIS